MCIRDSFKDNPGMTPLLQFKRYICARKLDNRPLAKELENLYGPMDLSLIHI